MAVLEETKLVGSVSLAEEAEAGQYHLHEEAEAGQYHLHEQIGEGACEWLPLERTRCPPPLTRSRWIH